MANKIQVRRGAFSDLPNPLDNGEFGWASDVKQLYIGNGVSNENLFVAGAAATTDFSIAVATTDLGGRTAANGATGLKLEGGTTTSASTNRLINGNATFTSALVNKTVENETDDTWAKVGCIVDANTLFLTDGVDITISGATQANPVVITATGHGLSNGDEVCITGIVGMTELNGRVFTVANQTANTFELFGEDGTGYAAYVSNGIAELGSDIMGVSKVYDIFDALSTVTDGFNAIPNSYAANVTLEFTPGTFSDDATLQGKSPQGAKTLTITGHAGGDTILSGAIQIKSDCTIKTLTPSGAWTVTANCTLSALTSVSGNWTVSGECTFTTLTTTGDWTISSKVTLTSFTITTGTYTANFGAEITWNTCTMSNDANLLIKSSSTAQRVVSSTITINNDPQNVTNINSTITTGYSIYVGTSAVGGDDTIADGLQIASGTTTGTSSNKLVDSTANFLKGATVDSQSTATSTTSNKLVDTTANFGAGDLNKTIRNTTDTTYARVTAIDSPTQLSLSSDIMVSGEAYDLLTPTAKDKTCYNSTDDTWSKITGVDSPTQLTLGTDIMVNTDAYVLANAFSTIQAAYDAIPGSFSANTKIKISQEDWGLNGQLVGQNKSPTGSFFITMEGSKGVASFTKQGTTSATDFSAGSAGAGHNLATFTDSGASFPTTGSGLTNYLLVLTGGSGAGEEFIIDSNTGTVLTLVGTFETVPDNTTTYEIYDLSVATTMDYSALSGDENIWTFALQKNIVVQYVNFEEWDGFYAIYARDYTNIKVLGCRFLISRTEKQKEAGVQVESFSVLNRIRACTFIESAGTRFFRALRIQQSGAPESGVNIETVRVDGCAQQFVIAASAFVSNVGRGNGCVLRNARQFGINLNSFARFDITEYVITNATTNGIRLQNIAFIIIRSRCEIDGAGGDGISNTGQSQILSTDPASVQINNNGGWGVQSTNLSVGLSVSSYSYSGNFSGTHTAPAGTFNVHT